jgi:5-methyltetrahydrofolate corrinoid/iron sulfur protein methyltransferase
MFTIAEKINATIPSVKSIIESRDKEALLALAIMQAEAGADYIDINVGTGSGSAEDEKEAMRWAVEEVQKEVETALCLDSADPAVLEAGLLARGDRPGLINSTKGSDYYLESVLPLAREFEKPIVGLAMDEQGIPKTVEQRVAACAKIASACDRYGVPRERIHFDPLVLPVSTDVKQGMVTLSTIQAIKEEFPECKTVMAISNISFGLPKRSVFNSAFLHMALFAGLDGAIMNVLDEQLIGAVRTGEAAVGRDKHCRKYSRYWRKR